MESGGNLLTSLRESVRLTASAASERVVGALVDALVEECHRTISETKDASSRVVALEPSPAPWPARSAARAVKRFLLHGQPNIVVNGQAGSVYVSGVREPHHVGAAGDAGVVTNHDRVTGAVSNVGKPNRLIGVLVIPDAAMVPTSPKAGAWLRAIRACYRGA